MVLEERLNLFLRQSNLPLNFGGQGEGSQGVNFVNRILFLFNELIHTTNNILGRSSNSW